MMVCMKIKIPEKCVRSFFLYLLCLYFLCLFVKGDVSMSENTVKNENENESVHVMSDDVTYPNMIPKINTRM